MRLSETLGIFRSRRLKPLVRNCSGNSLIARSTVSSDGVRVRQARVRDSLTSLSAA